MLDIDNMINLEENKLNRQHQGQYIHHSLAHAGLQTVEEAAEAVLDLWNNANF